MDEQPCTLNMADLETGQSNRGGVGDSQLPLLAPPVYYAHSERWPSAAASALPVGQQAVLPHSAAEPQPWSDAVGGLVDQPLSIAEALMTLTTTAVRLYLVTLLFQCHTVLVMEPEYHS